MDSAIRSCERQISLNAALMVLVIAAMARFFPSGAELQQRVAKEFPIASIRYLESHNVPQPMLNYYGFGGYLVWLAAQSTRSS